MSSATSTNEQMPAPASAKGTAATSITIASPIRLCQLLVELTQLFLVLE